MSKNCQRLLNMNPQLRPQKQTFKSIDEIPFFLLFRLRGLIINVVTGRKINLSLLGPDIRGASVTRVN